MPAALSLAKFSTFGICMGRSFLVGLCDDSHFTGLDRPAHFPRTKGHAAASGADTFTAAGQLLPTLHPRNSATAGWIARRGLRVFSFEAANV
jgi:hypothetical protein